MNNEFAAVAKSGDKYVICYFEEKQMAGYSPSHIEIICWYTAPGEFDKPENAIKEMVLRFLCGGLPEGQRISKSIYEIKTEPLYSQQYVDSLTKNEKDQLANYMCQEQIQNIKTVVTDTNLCWFLKEENGEYEIIHRYDGYSGPYERDCAHHAMGLIDMDRE